MLSHPKIIPQPRLLLVGHEAGWLAVVSEAAARIGATVDIQPDVAEAVAWMLPPSRIYSHVLATVPLSSQAIDALAGILDEVTFSPTPLLLLGCPARHNSAVRCINYPDADALVPALRSNWRSPPDLPPMDPAELSAALHAGALRMRFQPILGCADLQPLGVEALARVHHPTRGILHPRDFIPLAVANGQERTLTGIAAARTLLEMQSRLLSHGMYVSLNLPIVSLLHNEALERGLELCGMAGISPEQIVLEILESSDAPDLGFMRHALDRWRQAGFRLAIDDAGPALPHWRALLDLPFDILKLDGALLADPPSHDLAQTIVDTALARGLTVVAEGVEDEAGLERARAWGAQAVQGFLFSRPLPSLALPAWLHQWHPTTLTAASERAA